jgi:2'-5' RNA ligase
MQENKSRIFIGIPVQQSAYEKLKQLLCPHEMHFPKGHWILPENTHITIRFFGDIDHNQLDGLWNNIQSKINNHVKLFSISVEEIAPFPHKNSSLIAAYVNEHSEMQKLFSLINDVRVNSVHLNDKKFIPHITLYRNKNDVPAKLQTIFVKDCELVVDTLVLYKSQLIDGKRTYQRLHSIKLKK